jgi:hypothetical protein
MRMSLSDITRMLSDLADVAVTILLAYAVYKISKLIETIEGKIKGQASA